MEPILWFVSLLLISVLIASFGGDTIIQLLRKDKRVLNTTRRSRENVRISLDDTPARYKIIQITPINDSLSELHCRTVSPPFKTKDIDVSPIQLTCDLDGLMHTGIANLKFEQNGRRTITDEEYTRMDKTNAEVIKLRGEVAELKASARKASQMAVDQAAQLAGTQGSRGGYM